jgi:dipeptidyl-peptidase-4
MVDGEPVTPVALQVRGVLAAGDDRVVFQANPIDDATQLHVWQWDDTGLQPLTSAPGVHTASVGGATTVVRTATLEVSGSTTEVRTTDDESITIRSLAESPLVSPNPEILHVGERRLATAVLFPHDHDGTPLPVLLDPYGGPHALRVTRSRNA